LSAACPWQADNEYGVAGRMAAGWAGPEYFCTERRNSYKSWAAVFSDNFEDLRVRSLNRHETVMDEYGRTNPAEFFAVATETFFEKPHQLKKYALSCMKS
jgi:Mlc titration factor MtfA (ptsG expression regulator)